MRATIVLILCGCQSIAGIREVSLAIDGGPDTTDTAVTETAADTGRMETPGTVCTSTRGPAMVEVTAPGKKFCIDATEVTGEQFAEYAKLPGSPALPARCTGVTLTFPGPRGGVQAPQANVTWCDAFAFCAWAGKRLCHALDTAKPTGSDNSEWTYVCTQGLKTAYPYGDPFNTANCVIGKTATDAPPEPVATFENCTGTTPPYSDVYDMSGNVSEWVDECEGTKCRALGGYFGDTDKDALKCASLSGGTTVTQEANAVLSGLGFRCCKD